MKSIRTYNPRMIFHPGMILHPRIISFLAHFLALLALGSTALAQEDGVDSTWDDLGLDPEGFKLDEDIIGHVSAGWFPQAYSGYTLSFTGKLFYADVHDRAEGIRPRGLRTTTEPFTWRNPFDSDERDILQPNSEEEEDDGYPTTDHEEYLLTFLYNLPMPAIIRLQGGLEITEGMLFSEDTSRAYLTLGGAAQPFKEVGVAYLKQHSINGSAGLNIPVYGGFIKSEAITLASYYYLYAGYSFSYAVSSKGTQYVQIADAKENLRYGNGADTLTFINKDRFEELNRLRTAIEVGVGWNLAAEFGALGFEAFVSLPQSSVLKDVEWKQYFAGLRISVGWHWLPGKKERPGLPPP